MCFWGGPRGMYTNTGQVVGVNFPNNSLISQVSLTPDPTLAQTVVHYGHGTGVGAGGTPRAGEAIAWGASHFMFFGAISPETPARVRTRSLAIPSGRTWKRPGS
jgi:hypothetical protein